MMHSETLLNRKLELVVMATMLLWKPVKGHTFYLVNSFWVISFLS